MIAKKSLLESLTKRFGKNAVLTPHEVCTFASENGYERPNWLFTSNTKVSFGKYRLPDTIDASMAIAGMCFSTKHEPQYIPLADVQASEQEAVADLSAEVIPLRKPQEASQRFDPNAVSDHAYAEIPARDQHYVPFGEFKDIEMIIKSGHFFPVFISGLSGNGKTFMVEQAAARAKRPMIRVQMSRETDEDDLIGGFRLINGETKFLKGPILRAMELGALLLIDEADRADPGKVMCLQGILEGKNYYVKKTGEIVAPLRGFNIIVTANTKGKGSDDGRYVAASILDDAWLERFPITIEQSFPTAAVESKILRGYLCEDREATEPDEKFIQYLTTWAEIIRKTYSDDGIDEQISTRRLVHIVKTYGLFGDRMRSIRLCINRFDEETKTAFLDLYAKVDPTLSPVSSAPIAPDKTVGIGATNPANPF